MEIGILEPTDFSQGALEIIRCVGNVEFFQGGDRKKFLKDKAVLFIRLGHYVDDEFINEAPKLQVLVSPTTGVTHLDLAAAEKQEIDVLTLRDENEFLRTVTASSEHCLGMVLGVLRNYPHAIICPGNVHWNRDSVRGHDVRGLNIGVIGFGRIGQWLCRVLQVMGAKVRWYDSHAIGSKVSPDAIRCEGITQLIEASTLVVLSASYIPGSPPLLNSELIDSLKDKYLVNIGRGELLDEPHLLRRLCEGWFAGVALDVLSNEPKTHQELVELAGLVKKYNFMLTPHIGGATFESSHLTEEFMAHKLIQHLSLSGIAS